MVVAETSTGVPLLEYLRALESRLVRIWRRRTCSPHTSSFSEMWTRSSRSIMFPSRGSISRAASSSVVRTLTASAGELLSPAVETLGLEHAREQRHQVIARVGGSLDQLAAPFGGHLLVTQTQELDIALQRHGGVAQLVIHVGDELVFELVKLVELPDLYIGGADIPQSAPEGGRGGKHDDCEDPLLEDDHRAKETLLTSE